MGPAGNDFRRAPPEHVVDLRRIVRRSAIADDSSAACSRRAKAGKIVRKLELLIVELELYSIRLPHIAYILDLEETYCSSIFRDIAGKSFSKWMRGIRVRRAQELLQSSGYSITHISSLVGYSDMTTFGRNFRNELGISPLSYRTSMPDDRNGLAREEGLDRLKLDPTTSKEAAAHES